MVRLLYLPFSIGASLAAGFVARRLFAIGWSWFDERDELPGPDDPDETVGRVVAATAAQAAVFAGTKAFFDRGARRWFERSTGRFPAAKNKR